MGFAFAHTTTDAGQVAAAILLAYLALGILFWDVVVDQTLIDLAARGSEDGQHHMSGVCRATLALLTVKATVILLWPIFLVFGVATRCIASTREASTEPEQSLK